MLSESVQIYEKYQDDVLEYICNKFEIDKSKLNKLGSFESFVYEYEKNNQEFILKITHSYHRDMNQIMGELDWVNYLVSKGISACQSYPSVDGNLVERIDTDDTAFYGYICDKAKGDFTGANKWDETLFESWGAMLGKMHVATKEYTPSKESFQRFHWHNDPSLDIVGCLPPDQAKVLDTAKKLIDKLKTLPSGKDDYGLIHSDMHHGNFVVDNNELTAFDFDDSHYGYFAFDIMIPLYYFVLDKSVGTDNVKKAHTFFKHYIKGYRTQNEVESWWLESIPDFLKLREIDLYAIITRESADDESEWCKRFMEGKRERIENEIPVINLDFSSY